MNKLILFFLLLFVLVPFVSAEQQHLGYFKINSCVQLVQTAANTTGLNFTAVYYPDLSLAQGSVQATKTGDVFNASFCNTTKLGTYIVSGVANVSGYPTVFAYDFEVNAAGIEIKNSLTSLPIVIFLLLINGAMFLMFFRKNLTNNKYTNYMARQCCLLSGIYLMVWNSSIMASIAASAGLPLTTELFTYMQIFGWAGYVAMIFVVLNAIIRTFGEWKADKKEKRTGGMY